MLFGTKLVDVSHEGLLTGRLLGLTPVTVSSLTFGLDCLWFPAEVVGTVSPISMEDCEIFAAGAALIFVFCFSCKESMRFTVLVDTVLLVLALPCGICAFYIEMVNQKHYSLIGQYKTRTSK